MNFFKSVNIWQSYKQERNCLVHFLHHLGVCWPGVQTAWDIEITTLLLVTLPNIQLFKKILPLADSAIKLFALDKKKPSWVWGRAPAKIKFCAFSLKIWQLVASNLLIFFWESIDHSVSRVRLNLEGLATIWGPVPLGPSAKPPLNGWTDWDATCGADFCDERSH